MLSIFDQDDEIADPLGLTVVTTLVKWNLKADAKKDVCSSLALLGVPFSFDVKPVLKLSSPRRGLKEGWITKGSSINDVTPEGEGGGVPQKVTRGDKGEVPCFKQR